MSLSGDVMDYFSRYQTLQLQQDSADNLVKDLLMHCHLLEIRLKEETRRLQELSDHQRLHSKGEAQCNYTSNAKDSWKNRNPYILILIDGDGLLFRDAYVKQGIEGGKKAAYALRSAVANMCYEHAGEVEIVAKVCANLAGLCKAMRRDGAIDNEADLKDFSLGFTQAQASFDFVDVGHGKERADSKIKELTKWHLKNSNCQQVLLGVSHDAGYAPFLDDTLLDDGIRKRVSLIEGVPAVRQLEETGVNVVSFDDIFRTQKLLDRSVGGYSRSSSFAHVSRASNSSPSLESIASDDGPALPPGPASRSSWAEITSSGSASPPPKMTLPLANKSANIQPRSGPAQLKTKPPATVPASAWNPGARGRDPCIAVDLAVLDAIKRGGDKGKLCNNHFLRGPCIKADCEYDHNYKPDAEELKAIALMARWNPCSSGQSCDLEDCIYGHHCPSVVEGVCMRPFCKFRVEEHPPDTKFKNAHIRDNQ